MIDAASTSPLYHNEPCSESPFAPSSSPTSMPLSKEEKQASAAHSQWRSAYMSAQSSGVVLPSELTCAQPALVSVSVPRGDTPKPKPHSSVSSGQRCTGCNAHQSPHGSFWTITKESTSPRLVTRSSGYEKPPTKPEAVPQATPSVLTLHRYPLSGSAASGSATSRNVRCPTPLASSESST